MANKELTLRITALRGGRKLRSCELEGLVGLQATLKKVFEVVNSEASYYEDPVDEAEVCVTTEKSAVHDICSRILPHWCDISEALMLFSTSKPPEWWLSINGIENQILDGIEPSMEDKGVEIESFGLGTFLGLNTYVQHYASQPGGKARQLLRMTQQSVHFINCEDKMYLYFVDVKDPGQKSMWDGNTHARHRMHISYSSICRIVLVKRRDNSTVAYFHLLSSPLLYRVHKVQRKCNAEWEDDWNRKYNGNESAIRAANDDPEKSSPDDGSESEDDDEEAIAALKEEEGPSLSPQWDEKHIYVPQVEATSDSMWVRVVEFGKDDTHCGSGQLGRCRVLKVAFPRNPRHWDALGAMILHCRRKVPVYFGPVQEVPAKNGQGLASKSLPFGCQYALECCRSCSAQIADEVSVRGTAKEVSAMLQAFATEDETALQEALYDLQRSLCRNKVVTFKVGLGHLYERYKSLRKKERPFTGSVLGHDLPDNVTLVRKAVLTPTKTLFLPPQMVCKSRMLHNFEADHAMRVIVRDDDGQLLSFSLGVNREAFLASNTKPRLLKGFRVGNRKYDFLASSTSQLRDHGLYYYSKDSKGRTAAHIRADIGDLSAIRNPSKYMARLGLAFSQAIGYVHVPQSCTEVVEDILVPGRREGLQYNFSDGVGRISRSILQKVHQALPEEGEPCAIQIRYGGSKGMLVLDPTLEGDRIIFRKSMHKYPSWDEQLFVLKTSKPRVVKLNRPMITILAQKGPRDSRDIPLGVFLELQKRSLDAFVDSLFDSSGAAVTLHAQSALDLPYRELVAAGLRIHEEPFFRAMLRAIHRRSLKYIKQKGNILVPPEFGRTMFGVMDETGTLRYGQVFVRYAKDLQKGDPGDEYEVLEGDVIVTKNPCLHPGDIRRLRAVDVPALHHIRDCIVFPSVGKRPHPDEMAGSDLDGDEYSVIWYGDLVFRKNDDPMDFYSDDVPSKGGDIEVEDMMDFFCTYICNDVLGLIASAHLAWADFLKRGVKSDMCKTLARKASQSVDYAKTGRSQKLRSFEKVQRYPDFMEKHAKKDTYLSKSVLGRLYRNCTAMEVELGSAEAADGAWPDPRLLLVGRESYVAEAEKELRDYELKMMSLLTTYGIDTEAEALSGAIFSMEQYAEEKHNPDDMPVALQCQVAHIVKQTRKQFFDGLPEESDYREAKLKASAWYDVSYRGKNGGTSGFPWVVADVFRTILESCDARQPPERGTLCDRFKKRLLKGLQDDSEFAGVVTNNCIVVLHRWVECNAEVLRWEDEEGRKKYRHLTKQIADHVVKMLVKKYGKDRLKEQPSLVVLNCLKQAYDICFKITTLAPYDSSNRERYFLGVLALRTLNTMMATGSSDTLLEQEALPGDLRNAAVKCVLLVRVTNEESDFFYDVVRNERAFVVVLKRWANVEGVEVSVTKDRLDQWFLRLWVTGKPYAVEKLKGILVAEPFKELWTIVLDKWVKRARDKDDTE